MTARHSPLLTPPLKLAPEPVPCVRCGEPTDAPTTHGECAECAHQCHGCGETQRPSLPLDDDRLCLYCVAEAAKDAREAAIDDEGDRRRDDMRDGSFWGDAS